MVYDTEYMATVYENITYIIFQHNNIPLFSDIFSLSLKRLLENSQTNFFEIPTV